MVKRIMRYTKNVMSFLRVINDNFKVKNKKR